MKYYLDEEANMQQDISSANAHLDQHLHMMQKGRKKVNLDKLPAYLHNSEQKVDMSNEFGKLFPAKATVIDRMRELSTDSVMFKSEDDLPLLSVPKSTGVKTYG